MSTEILEVCSQCGCDDEQMICIDAEYVCTDCFSEMMANADFED